MPATPALRFHDPMLDWVPVVCAMGPPLQVRHRRPTPWLQTKVCKKIRLARQVCSLRGQQIFSRPHEFD